MLCAPDSFKGTLRATEVAAAMGRGIEAGGLRPDVCPIADGGEGTAEVLLLALGGETIGAAASDPLGRPLETSIALIEDGEAAIVELAQASGLGLVAEDERDPEAASTYGTGELIVAAVEAGAQVVLLAAGGSATTDGGAGAIAAIEERGGLHGARIVVLCDVRTPFERAAAVFAPQKGAEPDAVRRLEARLDAFAETLPRDPRGRSMSGAGGGVAGGLWAAFDAQLESGAAFVLDAVEFDQRMRAAVAVIGGEGRLDLQTLQGKALGEVGTRCRQSGVPFHAIVGQDALDPFEHRILDLQSVAEASTLEEIESAATAISVSLRGMED